MITCYFQFIYRKTGRLFFTNQNPFFKISFPVHQFWFTEILLPDLFNCYLFKFNHVHRKIDPAAHKLGFFRKYIASSFKLQPNRKIRRLHDLDYKYAFTNGMRETTGHNKYITRLNQYFFKTG